MQGGRVGRGSRPTTVGDGHGCRSLRGGSSIASNVARDRPMAEAALIPRRCRGADQWHRGRRAVRRRSCRGPAHEELPGTTYVRLQRAARPQFDPSTPRVDDAARWPPHRWPLVLTDSIAARALLRPGSIATVTVAVVSRPGTVRINRDIHTWHLAALPAQWCRFGRTGCGRNVIDRVRRHGLRELHRRDVADRLLQQAIGTVVCSSPQYGDALPATSQHAPCQAPKLRNNDMSSFRIHCSHRLLGPPRQVRPGARAGVKSMARVGDVIDNRSMARAFGSGKCPKARAASCLN